MCVGCARVFVGARGSSWVCEVFSRVCASVYERMRACAIVCEYVRVCANVCECVRVCLSVCEFV